MPPPTRTVSSSSIRRAAVVPARASPGTAPARRPGGGAARRWAVHNGCGRTATVRTEAPGVTETAFHGCRGSADVELYSVLGKGHQWPPAHPGGFAPNEVIWRFFAAHRRR